MNEVQLRVSGPSFFRDLAARFGVNVSIVDCKFFDSDRVALFFEVWGDNIQGFLEALREEQSVCKVHSESTNSYSAWGIAVMDSPPYCRVAKHNDVFCLNCPMSYSAGDRGSQSSKWRVLIGNRNSLRGAVAALADMGVKAELVNFAQSSVSLRSENKMLSPHQREVLKLAYELGYFEFPRKISLRQLARRLGVKPSSLSEVLRHAQSKVVSKFFEYEA